MYNLYPQYIVYMNRGAQQPRDAPRRRLGAEKRHPPPCRTSIRQTGHFNVTPNALATLILSLSPRPHRFTNTTFSSNFIVVLGEGDASYKP